MSETSDGGGLSGNAAVLVSAAVGVAATAVAYWWVGNVVIVEQLFRVAPTVQGGGVGTDWVVGNTVPILDALIAIVHAADVLLGVFVLGMVFVHWAIFRRLAGRMGSPTGPETTGTVAADGGETGGEDR